MWRQSVTFAKGSMQRKTFSAFLFTLCSVLLGMYFLGAQLTRFQNRFHLYHLRPYGPSPSGCLNPQVHLWEEDVPYGRPTVLINPSSKPSMTEGNTTDTVSRLFHVVCPDLQAVPAVERDFSDVLLIVGFGDPDLYQAAAFVEILYRRHFPHILYCSPDPDSLKMFIVQEKIDFPVLYLRVSGTSSQLKYECLEGAVKMCDNFTGYLFIGDDTLVNVKMFRKAPRDKVLVEGSFLKMGDGATAAEYYRQWSWWETTGGKVSLLGVLNELAYRAYRDNDSTASESLNNYFSFVNNSSAFQVMGAEFAYFPTRLASTLLYVTSLFRKYKANIEVALPFFVCGLDPKRDVHLVKARKLTGHYSQKSNRWFEDGVMYIHPVKHRGNFKNSNRRAFICDYYLHVG